MTTDLDEAREVMLDEVARRLAADRDADADRAVRELDLDRSIDRSIVGGDDRLIDGPAVGGDDRYAATTDTRRARGRSDSRRVSQGWGGERAVMILSGVVLTWNFLRGVGGGTSYSYRTIERRASLSLARPTSTTTEPRTSMPQLLRECL